MTSVDAAMARENRVQFALVRPPSHHACRNKAMGGCLLNSVAIAAHYALDRYENVERIAILDVDAHHGNGIAHCVQDNSAICYCSIHEDISSSTMLGQVTKEDNPRLPTSDDCGPLGNLCNIPLTKGTTWESGYRKALVEQAIPFLKEHHPDLLLIAAGFDALEADWTSQVRLTPQDFGRMGEILQEEFGFKVAFGLEGGYCWKDDVLCIAIDEFVGAWRKDV